MAVRNPIQEQGQSQQSVTDKDKDSFPSSSFSAADHSSAVDVSSAKASQSQALTPGQELAAKLVFGGIGCMVAVVFTNPVDVIKVRLQLQGEATTTPSHASAHAAESLNRLRTPAHTPTPAGLFSTSGSHLSSSSSPHSTLLANAIPHRDAALLVHEPLKPSPASATTATTPTLRLIPLLRQIVRAEGPQVFLAGLAPAVLRESIYSTIRFGSYDLFKGIYSGMGSTGLRGGEETSTLTKLLAGLSSGMVGSVIANPTDLIKVRLQAFNPSGTPRYKSIADACKSIYVEEGIPGLYRGVIPTAARAMVVTASQLASYDTTKHWLLRQRNKQGEAIFHEGYLTHFCASTVAGLVCSISTSPIDTVKVRYMNQQFNAQGRGALYSSAIDCAIKTVRHEGPLALYKGFLMCWLRLGPHTMLSLVIFEKLRSLFGINPV